MTAVQNTLSSAVTKASGYINAASMSGVANVYDNIYVESHAPKNLTYILNAPVYASTFACTVQNNFFYVTNAEKALQAGNNLPETVDGVIKYGRPRPLTMNPLDGDNWNPAEGRFGYKANLQFYKELNNTEIEGDVPANCGAQRGTAEAANYAARGYSSVNLGNY